MMVIIDHPVGISSGRLAQNPGIVQLAPKLAERFVEVICTGNWRKRCQPRAKLRFPEKRAPRFACYGNSLDVLPANFSPLQAETDRSARNTPERPGTPEFPFLNGGYNCA